VAPETEELGIGPLKREFSARVSAFADLVRMLEEGRSCEDIVTQMAAVAEAVNTAAFTLISASL
jgi:hypothetical protein